MKRASSTTVAILALVRATGAAHAAGDARSGNRLNPTMKPLAGTLSDGGTANAAAYYASLAKK